MYKAGWPVGGSAWLGSAEGVTRAETRLWHKIDQKKRFKTKTSKNAKPDFGMDPQCQNVSVLDGISTPKHAAIQAENLIFRSYKQNLIKYIPDLYSHNLVCQDAILKASRGPKHDFGTRFTKKTCQNKKHPKVRNPTLARTCGAKTSRSQTAFRRPSMQPYKSII